MLIMTILPKLPNTLIIMQNMPVMRLTINMLITMIIMPSIMHNMNHYADDV